MNLVIASIFCQDLGPFPFSHLWNPQFLSFLERHPPYRDSTWRSTQKARTNSRCLFSGVSILKRYPLREELTVPMFKMKQSIQSCTSIKDLPEMKPLYAAKRQCTWLFPILTHIQFVFLSTESHPSPVHKTSPPQQGKGKDACASILSSRCLSVCTIHMWSAGKWK